MTDFWKMHATETTLEAGILDSTSDALDEIERPEILHMLPEYEGTKLLELGAGIGRFTGILAEKAEHVTAVDFMESFVEKNKETNGHHKNIDFLQADVTQLQLKENSFDIVFTNWLLMYLTDNEVRNFVKTSLLWLKEDGYLFVKEACFESGEKLREVDVRSENDSSRHTGHHK
ncbi:uncharacterized protein LOC144444192 [Glandiceps talaboti]